MNLIDMTGEKIGKWTVLKRIGNPKKIKKGTYWLCRCECGLEKAVDGNTLRRGGSKSCGNCSRGLNLTNKRFGRLVAIKKIPKKMDAKQSSICWKCLCDCGNMVEVTSRSLISGNTKSCGCLFKESISKKYQESTFNAVYRTYIRSAKNRNLLFELNEKDFRDIIEKNCYYCNCPPSNVMVSNYNNGDFIYSGIDRIDNSLGYIKDNVVPCCSICNHAKNIMNQPNFRDWVIRIYNNWIG